MIPENVARGYIEQLREYGTEKSLGGADLIEEALASRPVISTTRDALAALAEELAVARPVIEAARALALAISESETFEPPQELMTQDLVALLTRGDYIAIFDKAWPALDEAVRAYDAREGQT